MARDVGFVSWPQEPSLAPASQSSSECLLLSQKKARDVGDGQADLPPTGSGSNQSTSQVREWQLKS